MKKSIQQKLHVVSVFIFIAGVSSGYAATINWDGQKKSPGALGDVPEAGLLDALSLMVSPPPAPHLQLQLPPPPPPSPQSVLYQSIFEFFLLPEYLDNNPLGARRATELWIRRGNCGDVERLKFAYTQYYNFAYSPKGLDYTRKWAKIYAADATGAHTPCGDLLR